MDDEEGIGLLDVLDIVLDHKWVVAGITAIGMAIGAAYSLFATTIYEAETILPVEESMGSANGLFPDAPSLTDIRSLATAPIEILPLCKGVCNVEATVPHD